MEGCSLFVNFTPTPFILLTARMALLGAALAEFGERSYDSASTRGICKRAGVASTLITHHFGTKEALWQAAAPHVSSFMRSALTGVYEVCRVWIWRPACD